MNDQYERRALLLHLGDVFATIHAVAKCRDQYASLADAIGIVEKRKIWKSASVLATF